MTHMSLSIIRENACSSTFFCLDKKNIRSLRLHSEVRIVEWHMNLSFRKQGPNNEYYLMHHADYL